MRPPRLDEGLAAALADLARGAAIPVEVAATPDRAPPEVEAAAYFVACEALTNAVKHAAPSRVIVQAAREADVLRLTIADDGVGGAAAAGGSGLPGMRDRVAAQGGTLAIESPPGAGTRIAVELPCAIVIAEDTVLLREGLAGLLEDAGHEVVGTRRRRRDAARARRRARARPGGRRRPHAAGLRRRGHARGGGHPRVAPGDGGAGALPAHRDAPRRRAGHRRRRLRLPAQGPRARRRRLPRRRPPRRRRRHRARSAGRGHAAGRAAAGDRRSQELTPREAEVLGADGRGAHERRHRAPAVADREDGRGPRALDPDEARPAGQRRRPPAGASRTGVPARTQGVALGEVRCWPRCGGQRRSVASSAC